MGVLVLVFLMGIKFKFFFTLLSFAFSNLVFLVLYKHDTVRTPAGFENYNDGASPAVSRLWNRAQKTTPAMKVAIEIPL